MTNLFTYTTRYNILDICVKTYRVHRGKVVCYEDRGLRHFRHHMYNGLFHGDSLLVTPTTDC